MWNVNHLSRDEGHELMSGKLYPHTRPEQSRNHYFVEPDMPDIKWGDCPWITWRFQKNIDFLKFGLHRTYNNLFGNGRQTVTLDVTDHTYIGRRANSF